MKKMVKSNIELHFRLLHLHPHYGKPPLIFYSAFHTPILCRLHVRREYLAADAEMNPAASHMWWNIISDNSAIFKKISEKMMSSCVGIPFRILSSVVVRQHIPWG